MAHKHILEWDGAEPRRLLDLIEAAGIEVESPCGGRGKCGKCRVNVDGDCAAPSDDEKAHLSPEELEQGIRLACCCSVIKKVTIFTRKAENKARILEKSSCHEFRSTPAIRKQAFSLTMENGPGSLSASLLHQLQLPPNEQLSLHILKFLGEHGQSGTLTAVLKNDRVLGVEASDTTSACFGVAVDIGTTTIVAGLYELSSGRELAVASDLNPQKKFGLDVLSRIQFTQNTPFGEELLQKEIVHCLNMLIEDLCKRAEVVCQNIYEVMVAGNTVMLHLLSGVNPRQLGRSPYQSVFLNAQEICAKSLGLNLSPFARVCCLPSVSSFIGADIVAGLMAVDLDHEQGTSLFLDIGTNGEIVLCNKGELLSCSAAAGPALEGMNISCGMRAAEGAVEEVQLQGGVKLRTIGDLPPAGICGSGLLDLVSQLIEAGIISSNGRIAAKERFLEEDPFSPLSGHITEVEGKRKFLLTFPQETRGKEIYLTQADVRQVQLAKAAITAGIKVLLEKANITEEDVDKVYLAGAFGTYIKPESLIRLGLFPVIWKDRISFVGNSAKSGAAMALLSQSERQRAEVISGRVHYFELSLCPNFEELYAKNMYFPDS